MTGTAEPIMSMRGVSVTFRARTGSIPKRAVDDVSLDVTPSEAIALVGESGSGKSTLAKAMIGLLPTTAGDIIYRGMPVRSLRGSRRRVFRRNVSFVWQEPKANFDPRWRFSGLMREPLKVHRIPRHADWDAMISMALEAVGLDDSILSRRPSEVSGGQAQRMAIARAYLLGPEFVVLDEVTASLDASVAAQVLNMLADLREKHGGTVFIISHKLAEVRFIADRVAVMHEGRLVEVGPTTRVYEQPEDPYTRRLLSATLRVNAAVDYGRAVKSQAQAGAAIREVSDGGSPVRRRRVFGNNWKAS